MQKKKRGIVYLEATIGRLFLPDIKIQGHYEVTILEETENHYHIRFKEDLLREARGVPEWVAKRSCTLIQ